MSLRRAALLAASLAALAAAPAGAALPPYEVGPFVLVSVSSEIAGISFFRTYTLDTQTGILDLTLDDEDFAPSLASVFVDLTLHVEADPKIAYTLSVANGSAEDVDIRVVVNSVAEPYDQTSSGRQSLSVTAVDGGGGGGVSVIPNSVDGGGGAPAVQRFFASAQDLLNPPYAQTFGTQATRALFTTTLGSGRSDDASGPTTVEEPDLTVASLTPDGKWNKIVSETAFFLSAGDSATFEGVGEIAAGLGGGDGFPTYFGTLTGARSIKAAKIGKLKEQDFPLQVVIGETSWSAEDSSERVLGGGADVRRNGRTIKLSFDESGAEALRTSIAAALSLQAGGPVEVEFRKPPKAAASIRNDGAKSRLVISAKIRATFGEVTKNGTAKIVLRGVTSTD